MHNIYSLSTLALSFTCTCMHRVLLPLRKRHQGQSAGTLWELLCRKYSPKSSLITSPIFCESSLSLRLLSSVICLPLISWQRREKRCSSDGFLSTRGLAQQEEFAQAHVELSVSQKQQTAVGINDNRNRDY